MFMGFCGESMHNLLEPYIIVNKKAVKRLMNSDRFLHVFCFSEDRQETPNKFDSWWSSRQTMFG